MITGDIKTKIDNIWQSMWNNGMADAKTNILQITYLLFIKMLDDNQIKAEKMRRAIGLPCDDLTFKNGNYINEQLGIDVPYKNLRWSEFCHFSPQDMFDTIKNNVFPFIKNLHGEDNTAFARSMESAKFDIPKPVILTSVVDGLSDETLKLDNIDLMGDVYEYLLAKLATNGSNGAFRTPTHIIKMMVQMMKPNLDNIICDPAMGSGGFLVESSKYISEHQEKELLNTENRNKYNSSMFTGYDVDPNMLQIACMNMTLHGVSDPNLSYANSLTDDVIDKEKYSMVLANPPFAGSLNKELVSKSLNQIVSSTKTELLFLAQMLNSLVIGGRCACIVPSGVLNNNPNAYDIIRKELILNHQLEAVIYMPNGIFQPYSNVQTGILIFTKTGNGGTDKVWMYDMRSDGKTLDVKRDQIIVDGKPDYGDIPDIITRFENLANEESRTPYDQSFLVSLQELVDNNYSLSLNNYQKKESVKVEYESSNVIIGKIEDYQKQITNAIAKFKKLMEE